MPLNVTLIQAIPKQDKCSIIVDDVCQCGVKEIIPVFMKRTEVKWDFKKQEKLHYRWQAKASSAARQSRLPYIPKVRPIMTFSECISTIDWSKFDCCFVAWEECSSMSLKRLISKFSNISSVCVLIGPEGV